MCFAYENVMKNRFEWRNALNEGIENERIYGYNELITIYGILRSLENNYNAT